jgi:hypothetical protein
MPEVVYIGPFDAVDVVIGGHRMVTAKHGEITRVPSADVAALLAQSDNWAKPTMTKADKAEED